MAMADFLAVCAFARKEMTGLVVTVALEVVVGVVDAGGFGCRL